MPFTLHVNLFQFSRWRASSAAWPREVPHARRGVTLRQLRDIRDGYVANGYLKKKCAEFNKKHAAEIKAGSKRAMKENLHALNKFVVKPTTAPGGDVPADVLAKATKPNSIMRP